LATFKQWRESEVTRKPQQKDTTHAERVRRGRGANKSEPPGRDLLTPNELLDALRDDVIAISRATEMRIRELTILATEYAQGKIGAEEANARYYAYARRWPEPINGVISVEGKTDAEIFREADDARKELRAPLFPETGKRGGPVR
jgi:hypothetical protein